MESKRNPFISASAHQLAQICSQQHLLGKSRAFEFGGGVTSSPPFKMAVRHVSHPCKGSDSQALMMSAETGSFVSQDMLYCVVVN